MYSARVADARVLTTQDAIKKVWHVELALPDEVTYTPGQSFGIIILCSKNSRKLFFYLEQLHLFTPFSVQELSVIIRQRMSTHYYVAFACTIAVKESSG